MFLSFSFTHYILYNYIIHAYFPPSEVVCPKSYLYTKMTLGLFTNIAIIGASETYYRYVSGSGSQRIHPIRFLDLIRIPIGSDSFIWFLWSSPLDPHSDPIWSDRVPNKPSLHSDMGCLVNPIRLLHTSNSSADNNLVSMFDPFSSVWIFISKNSLSSTFSRSQWYLLWMCLVWEW